MYRPASPAPAQDLDLRMLHEVEAGRGVSQRLLASNLGVALGLANLLLRRLVRRGLVEIVKIRPNRVRYVITPAGIAEKARMTRAYLDYSVRFYSEARERLQHSFQHVSASWPAEEAEAKRVVFYGAGELAEIGYVCLQDSDLELVGVVDDERRRPSFFGLPVHAPEALATGRVGGVPYGGVIVMSLWDVDARRARLVELGCAADRIHTL